MSLALCASNHFAVSPSYICSSSSTLDLILHHFVFLPLVLSELCFLPQYVTRSTRCGQTVLEREWEEDHPEEVISFHIPSRLISPSLFTIDSLRVCSFVLDVTYAVFPSLMSNRKSISLSRRATTWPVPKTGAQAIFSQAIGWSSGWCRQFSLLW